jgi:hypothetical protein
MHKDGDHIDVTEEEASGGVKNHGVRYVLAISLLLVIDVDDRRDYKLGLLKIERVTPNSDLRAGPLWSFS